MSSSCTCRRNEPGDRRRDRHEHYRADDAFTRFLDDVVKRAVRESRTWRVFGGPSPDTSEPASIAKLDAIACGTRKPGAPAFVEIRREGPRALVASA